MKNAIMVMLTLASLNLSAHEFALKESTVEIAGKETTAYTLSNKVLYTFEMDSKGIKSNCTKTCAEIWPPVLLTDKEASELVTKNGEVEIYDQKGGESDKAGFGILKRAGLNQLTFNGYPLYTYAFDRSEDDAYGDEHNATGVEGWYTFTQDFVGMD